MTAYKLYTSIKCMFCIDLFFKDSSRLSPVHDQGANLIMITSSARNPFHSFDQMHRIECHIRVERTGNGPRIFTWRFYHSFHHYKLTQSVGLLIEHCKFHSNMVFIMTLWIGNGAILKNSSLWQLKEI